jgi:hypothetical protein
MSKLKELICTKADEIAIDEYGKEFYELDIDKQDKIWKKAEEAGQELIAQQIDRKHERI